MATIRGWKEGKKFEDLRQWESLTKRGGFSSEVGVRLKENLVIIWSNRTKSFFYVGKQFKTQKEALAYAMKWMREHPKG